MPWAQKLQQTEDDGMSFNGRSELKYRTDARLVGVGEHSEDLNSELLSRKRTQL